MLEFFITALIGSSDKWMEISPDNNKKIIFLNFVIEQAKIASTYRHYIHSGVVMGRFRMKHHTLGKVY